MKNLRSIIAALCISVSLAFPARAFSEKETVSDKTYPIEMTYDYGGKTTESIRIKADLDSENNTLYLGIYTQDYNRKNWIGDEKIRLPVSSRHTRINQNHTRVIVYRLPRAKIEEIEQRTYTVPSYSWSLNKSYKESQIGQIVVEAGETTLSTLFSAIPFLNRFYDKFVENTKEEDQKRLDEIAERIGEDCVSTEILPYIPKAFLMGQIGTATEYVIKFDTGNISDEIPTCILLKIALGDSTYASYGSPPNKYGELENILIKFILNEDKIGREELDAYFFHEEELEHLNRAKKNVAGTESNPAIMTVRNMKYSERILYEEDRIIRIGVGEYFLPEIGSYSKEQDFHLDVKQFETSKDREDYLERRKERLTYPYFYEGTILSFLSKPTIEDVLSPLKNFSEEQQSIYFDLLLDYMDRTGMQLVISGNKMEDEEIFKAIKEQQLKSEEE